MNFIRRVSGSSIISARRWLAVWLILGAAAWLLQGPGQRTEAARGLTLQGEAAIAQLKREGSYDSLAAAYRAAAGDPWSRVTKLAQPDFEKEDLFGAATAISGDTAVIGASNGDLELKADRGAAYVFVRYGAVWALQQKLWAPNGATYDEFGRAVAIGGDTLVIGAPGHNQSAGSAYVFVRSNGVWTMQKELTAPGAKARAQFGGSVALSGDTIAVGEWNGDAGLTKPGAGRCLVFIRAGTNWMPQATLLASDAQVGDQLGWSVALSGNTLIAGAPGSDTVENPKEPGAAYVFTRTGTVWSQQQKLTAADAGVGDHFGYAVGLSGETAVVGAPRNKIGASDDQGAAYVFTRAGAVWSQQQQLLAADGGAGDLFGLSVAVSGQTAAVGAPGRDGDTGVAFAFVRSGTVWSQQRKFAAVPGQPLDIFGASVSISGETVLASAPLLPRGPAAQSIGQLGKEPQARELFGFPSIAPASYGLIHPQGTVGVFTRTGASWTQEARLMGQNAPEIEEFFGSVVAISGDTAVVSAPSYRIQVGGVFVFVRRHGFWELQQRLDSPNNQRYDFFGLAVAISGDTIAVGAPGVQNSPTNRGAIFVFTRVGDLWSMEQRLTAGDTRPVVYFGQAVALDGETIAGGDPVVDYRTPRQGAVYVFTRTDGSWSQRRKLTGASPGNDKFGEAIALRGTILAIGAPEETVGANRLQGAAYVFTGSGANWTQQARLFRQMGAIGDLFGQSVAVSGESVAIGASYEENGAAYDSGAVHVYVRAGATWQLQQRLTPPMPRSGGHFGGAVALRGDTIVSGAPGEGAIEIFARAGGVWTQQTRLTRPEGAAAEGNIFGVSVAINEARDAMLIGNSSDWVGNMEGAGSAYIFEPPATPPCEFAIAPASATIGPATETGNVTVTASEAGCAWTAQSNASWITLSNFGGTGNGAVGYLATANRGARRTGTATIAGRTFTLTQEAFVCAVTIGPATLPGGAMGEPYEQMVTAAGGSAPFVAGIAAGALPAGLSLTATPAGARLAGQPAEAGAFDFTIQVTDANGCTASRSYALTIEPPAPIPTGLQFYPLPHPVRLLDTRPGKQGCDAPGEKIPGNTSRRQPAAGRVCSGLTIPAGASALAGNITTVESGGGYLTLYPGDATRPLAANSNYRPNEILNNAFTVGLGGEDGAFQIFVTSDTDLVIDITGYYAPPAAGGLYFHPLPKPIRLLETRPGKAGCTSPGTPVDSGAAQKQGAHLTCNGVAIPATAKAIVGNATSLNSGDGYLTLYPQGAARPLAASSNFTAGQVMNAPFTVGLGASGEFMIYSTTRTDLVIDVLGYYSEEATDANGAGLLFHPLAAPVRLLETRAGFRGCWQTGAPLAANSIRQQQARGACGGETIAEQARAIIGNATVVAPATGGWLTFWPNGAAQPLIATSNFTAGQIFNRQVTAGLDATGLFNVFTTSLTELVIDVSGYFAP